MTKIGGVSQPVASCRKQPVASIDEQIRKLEEQKRKIQQDLQRQSSNPDPLAARGDNDANRKVNAQILQRIEMQIRNLENRKEQNSEQQTSTEVSLQEKPEDLEKHLLDIYA